MKGLVTVFGGSGFVGAQVVRALAKAGRRVRVAVRQPGRGYRLPMLGEVGQIEVVQANLRDAPSVRRALQGAEACVNAVGVLFERGRQGFDAIHVDGVATIAATAREAGIGRLVHISALGADPASASAYLKSKAEGEAAARAGVPDAVILRPSVVFGAGDRFFNRFAAMAEISPVLPLIGGGATRMQPVFVGDVASAVARALDLADPGEFELGGPATYSFKELMELVLREVRRPRLLAPVPFALAAILGRAGDAIAASGLLAPPLTTDQLKMLRRDNVVGSGARGLADLGIVPQALEPIIATYLWRFRKGGQYADATRAAAALPAR